MFGLYCMVLSLKVQLASSLTSLDYVGAAVTQWICLRLPFCCPGSNPKHTIYTFINLNLNLNCNMLKRRKEKKKRPGLALFLKKTFNNKNYFKFLVAPPIRPTLFW